MFKLALVAGYAVHGAPQEAYVLQSRGFAEDGPFRPRLRELSAASKPRARQQRSANHSEARFPIMRSH